MPPAPSHHDRVRPGTPRRPRARLASVLLALLASVLGALPACASSEGSSAPLVQPRASTEVTVTYIRPDRDYDGWNLWVWPENGEGGRIDFTDITEAGATVTIPWANASTRLGFIVRRGEWAEKDIDHDRMIDPSTQSDVYLLSGDPTVYTRPDQIDFSTRVTGAFLDSADDVTFGVTQLLTDEQRSGVTVRSSKGEYRVAKVARVESGSASRLAYVATLDRPVVAEHVASLTLVVPGTNTEGEPATVYARDALNAPRFVPDPTLDLGPAYSPARTTFRTWSPVSESVHLLLYDRLGDDEPAREIPLAPRGEGLWETTVDGDLNNTPYRYRFRSYGVDRPAPDIHTTAASGDSAYSVVVDLDALAPAGWEGDTPPTIEHQTDEVIYEIHVRDYSIADPTCPEPHRGMYLGLANPGDESAVATGIRHLTDLGVTAVHLMPIHDFTAPRGQYNWGYWTALFNVPESNYATAETPGLATLELRTAIKALHEAGIRVILDVVYNHTSTSLDASPFHNTVPYYYHRTTLDGRLMNDSGTGNAIADERPMAREYIADSLEFWVREYHVDGYRFDLLGMHVPASVREWTRRLKAIRPDLTLYGEPWTGGGTIHFPKGAQRGLPIAVFNDHHRNAIRGDLDGTVTGFATGPGGDLEAVRKGVMGAIDDFADQPGEVITYVSAHDNLALWDKIELSQPKLTEAQRLAMQRLSLGVVLTSQGTAFLHGGSDFARTKHGDHNSYQSGDEINRFDWQRKAEFRGLHDFVRALIAIRRAHPAFRMRTAEDIRGAIAFLDTPDSGPLAFTIDGTVSGDEWGEILVAYNYHPGEATLSLPAGADWNVVVDNDRAAPEAWGTASGTHAMPPYSMTVLHRD
ncbi:MAG: type I pullulanase [Phycisphaerales bacterium JB040]